MLFQMSSWYVSGSIEGKKESNSMKSKLGKMAKRIIDIGRALYFSEKSGIKIRLERYCDENLSPENMILIGSL